LKVQNGCYIRVIQEIIFIKTKMKREVLLLD